MKDVSTVRKINFAHIARDGEDAVAYQWEILPGILRCTPGGRLVGNDEADKQTLTVRCYRTVGSERTEIKYVALNPNLSSEGILRTQYKVLYTSGDTGWKEIPPSRSITVVTDGQSVYPKVQFRVVSLPQISTDPFVQLSAITEIGYVCDGIDGAAGKVGAFTPPPMDWEDYPAGYEFQNGTDEGSERLDVVLTRTKVNGVVGYVPYACAVTHIKSGEHEPADDNDGISGIANPYWKHCDAGIYNIVATQVLLAENSFIKLMSTNGIQIYCGANLVGEIVGSVANGNTHTIWIGGTLQNPQWAVDGDGTHYFGGRSNKRIEIRPSAKEVAIHDENGREVVLLDGASHTIGGLYGSHNSIPHEWPDKKFFQNEETSVNVATFNVGNAGAYIDFKTIIHAVPTETRYFRGSGSSAMLVKVSSNVSATMTLYKKIAGSYESFRQVIQTASGSTGNTTTEGTEETPKDLWLQIYNNGKKLESGEYKLEVSIDASMNASEGHNAPASAYITRYSASFKAGSSPRSVVAASGIATAFTTQDYFRAGCDEGTENFATELCAGENGIRVAQNGIFARDKNGAWRKIKLTFE